MFRIAKLSRTIQSSNTIRLMSTYKFKIALCQLAVTSDKSKNIAKAVSAIQHAAKKKSQLVVLPECFNSPYGTQYFDEYAEDPNKSETLDAISKVAKESNVYVVAGSIPTRESNKLYNTSHVFDPNGKLIAVHRKVDHYNFLCDIDL